MKPLQESPEGSWELLREIMAGTRRSAAWREVGEWTLCTLEAHLGPSWATDILTSDDALRSRLAAIASHPSSYARLLELALRLNETSDLPGRATLKRSLRTDRRLASFVHCELILEVVSLGQILGLRSAIELNVAGRRNPIDVVMTWDSREVPIEITAVFTDDQSRRSQDAIGRIRQFTEQISFRLGLTMTLDIDELPEDLGELEKGIESTALAACARNTKVRRESSGGHIVADAVGPSLPTISGPAIVADGWRRTRQKLLAKEQTPYSSEPVWLRLDVMDGFWQFTPWSQMSLPEKLSTLSDQVRNDLSGSGGVAGVVLTPGAAWNQGFQFVDETIRHIGTGETALRRLLPGGRVRETLIIPLHEGHRSGAALWSSLYAAEPNWLDESLAREALPDTEAIFLLSPTT